MPDLPIVDLIRKLPAEVPFVGPEVIERRQGRPFDLRIGANESAFGVSPRAAEAMREAIERLAWYGDPESAELRAALGERLSRPPDTICVAAGIDELLGLLVRILVAPGTPVVSSKGAYPTFSYHVNGAGGVLHQVPYDGRFEDPRALAEAARQTRSPLVYLANPDNPLGSCHDAGAIREMLERLADDCVLILDEAYHDFAPAAADVESADSRLVRMRTFSKAHGMAGARIGYAFGEPPLIEQFNKIRNHFGVNRIAQAGALASLADDDFLSTVVAEVARGREDYYRLGQRTGLPCLPSTTNFVAFDAGRGERARRLRDDLEARGVFVRVPGAPLDRYVRVTVGTAPERARFAAMLEDLVGD